MYRGSLPKFYWRKYTHEIIDVVCPHSNVERIKIRQYLSIILKCDTLIDDMKENIDYWLSSFKKFHKQYIIMPTE